MPRLSKILGFIVICFLLFSTITFALSLLVLGVAGISLYGLYRYFRAKKIAHGRKTRPMPRGYESGEIIDMTVEKRRD